MINFYKNISILYAEYDTKNRFNRELLKCICKNFNHSVGLNNTIDIYNDYKVVNKFSYDVVIIDADFGIEIIDKILSFNPKQKIIVNIHLGNNDTTEQFQKKGLKYFIYEPLSTKDVSKVIINMITDFDHNNLLSRSMKDYEKLDIESSKLVMLYENKLLEMENKLKHQSDFFASMNHEIRTPMNAIIGMSQILLNDTSLTTSQLKTSTTINRSSNMLLGIINDILDFSKIEAGKLTLEHISFDLNMILDYIADMIGLKIKEQRLELIFDIDHTVDKNYIGDPLRISQILLNLMSNAVKFTGQGSITLHVRVLKDIDKSSYIQFEVKDTGIGIKKEKITSLFQNYTQADDETSRKYGGTGLGLSISKQLTALMHGEIWAESIYGEGTSFFVNLLLTKDSSDKSRRYRLPSKELMNKKVLIVDSREKSAKALKHMLEYFRLPVTTAFNLDDTKKILSKEKFDILFIDETFFSMCDEDGSHNHAIEHIVIIQDWMDSLSHDDSKYHDVYHYLKRPFNQKMVFETLLSLYNYNNKIEDTSKDPYTIEALATLGEHKILLAEDNKINQDVIKGLLLGTDIEVICANDGQEAVEELSKSSYKYKLILMDINMPRLDGYDTTIKIRMDEKYKDTSIIALTGDTSDENVQRALDSGMQGHLCKPIDVKALYKTIYQTLTHL